MLFNTNRHPEKTQKININNQSFSSNESSLEKRVSTLIFQVNGITVIDEILQIFNNLKLAKTEAIHAYELLSNSIKEELVSLIEEIYQYKLKNLELDKKIDLISVEIKSFASSADPNKSLDTCSEYNKFLEAYKESLTFSQEIVAKKMRLEVLIETQKLLDASYASKCMEIDFQLLKLSDIIDNFQQMKTESLQTSFAPEFSYSRSYMSMVLEKDHQFDNICKDLNVSSNKLSPFNPYSTDSLNDLVSVINAK